MKKQEYFAITRILQKPYGRKRLEPGSVPMIFPTTGVNVVKTGEQHLVLGEKLYVCEATIKPKEIHPMRAVVDKQSTEIFLEDNFKEKIF